MIQWRKPLPALTGRELRIGAGYLLFQLLILPALLQGFNSLLPYPMGAGLVNFLFFAINAMAVTGIFSRLLKKSLLRFGRRPGGTLIVFLGGIALYWLSLTGMSFLLSLLAPDFVNFNDGGIADLAQDCFWLTAIGTVVLVPLAEETLYRGLVFGGLYPRSPAAAYTVSSLLFSAIHILSYAGAYKPAHLLLAFLLYLPAGLILACAYRRSGTLLCPMLIHAAVNAIGIASMR